jgi:hypothetical protein
MSYRLDQGVDVCPRSLGDAQANRAIKTKLNYDIPFKIPITKGAQNINIRLQKCLYLVNNEDVITTSTIIKGLIYQNREQTVFAKKYAGSVKRFGIHQEDLQDLKFFLVYEDN